MQLNILCTGGAGYIGSHTVIELLKQKHKVTILDNLVNAEEEVVNRLKEICQCSDLPLLRVDMKDKEAMMRVFKENHFDAVIHYAGLKAVGDSVSYPLEYYDNNIGGTINLLHAMEAAGCRTLVFSSSATVYKAKETPITESDPLGPSNPYGQTKFMIEQILQDLFIAKPEWRISMLRYFNPVGAHPSGRIGEAPQHPTNLLPIIQQVAVGRREKLIVCGNDWATPDGTGVRDYLHVEDLAVGHVSALNGLMKSSAGQIVIYNLGTGNGTSVLEMVKMFEEVSGKKITHVIGPRRPGDLATVVADCSKAEKELGWKATRTIRDACASAWKWQSENPLGYSKTQ